MPTPPKSRKFSTQIGSDPDFPPRPVASFVNEHAPSICESTSSFVNSYSTRVYCRVISGIDTGSRNLARVISGIR